MEKRAPIGCIQSEGREKMTDKELRHLSCFDLIDIIYELQKQNDASAAQIEELQSKLKEKELRIASAGSIAEAAIGINGVFEAAQAAADQYLLSVKAANAAVTEKLDEAEKQRQAILCAAEQRAAKLNAAAERKARAMIAEANAQIEEKWAAFEQRTNELISAREELQALIKKDSK